MNIDTSKIRNFCIIAHIDHGKSTLADRMLQMTDTVSDRDFRDQLLDDMDLERERGITIKSHPVTMTYKADNGDVYQFNLIDTPGHVDFSYEVSRSMAACEGALLVVDAAQGVEAQTVANTYLAIDRGLEILPVLNKVDLPNAKVDESAEQIEDVLGVDATGILSISAKTGLGVEALMEAVVTCIPHPPLDRDEKPLRAMVFDSIYDPFRGVVTYVRVIDGVLKPRDRVRFMSSGNDTEVKEVGIFEPEMEACGSLKAGSVGYMIGAIKSASDILIGDTVTGSLRPASEPLPGFQEVRSMVFSGIYPADTNDYEKFRQSLEKLSINDSAVTFHPETSLALGLGFRCGFLGLLHMEVTQERLSREFGIDVITTHPAVIYRVLLKNAERIEVDNPADLPDPTRIETIEEPFIKAFIISPSEFIGEIMKLVMDKRGEVTRTDSMDARRVMLTCSMPLNEIVIDFHDTLKSVTRGYASMDYEYAGFQVSDIVKLDILLNSEAIDAFSCLVHRTKASTRGRQICKALKDAIPPHMFSIPVQAALNGTIVARETIRAFRKDVTAKLYGGDVTRKQKLLKKQKAGTKRMKAFGQVNVPHKAFVSVLRTSND
ncbi:MAG: translation elongation factor 4 [Kiritimatiellae bacterium]|nr:translation elongation factor 4 [Kiritimatiellia bacterium]